VLDKETFSKNVVSLDKGTYASMMHKMALPLRILQTTRAVGPFVWWEYDEDAQNPCFRKSQEKMP